MSGVASVPQIQIPDVPPMPVFDPVAEAKKKAELDKARAERAKQLKRGPGVAALVQGALKRALTTPVVKKDDEKDKAKAQDIDDDSDQDDEDEATLLRKKEEQEKAEQKQKELEERLARQREQQ